MTAISISGDRVRCDRCGCEMQFEDSAFDIQSTFWFAVIFKNKNRPTEIKGDFCKQCAVAMTPFVYRMRDVMELITFTNKLKKAINELRNKNNRPTQNNAGNSP